MADPMEGLNEVLDNIKRLGNPKKARSAAVKAARKAMAIVNKEAKKNAKSIDDAETGRAIYKNIATKAKKTKNKEEVIMSVGVKGGAKSPANPDGMSTWYWRFLELGNVNSPAQPFLRIAMYSKMTEVEKQFTDTFSELIRKELD